MSCKQDSQSAHVLASKPSVAFSTLSAAASATSAGSARSGGSRLLFGEIDTSSDRCTRVCSIPILRKQHLTGIEQRPKATRQSAALCFATVVLSSNSGWKTSAATVSSRMSRRAIWRVCDSPVMISVCGLRRHCSTISALHFERAPLPSLPD